MVPISRCLCVCYGFLVNVTFLAYFCVTLNETEESDQLESSFCTITVCTFSTIEINYFVEVRINSIFSA